MNLICLALLKFTLSLSAAAAESPIGDCPKDELKANKTDTELLAFANRKKLEGDALMDYTKRRCAYTLALSAYAIHSLHNPKDSAGPTGTADLYFDIRDLGPAAKNYHQALALDPKHPHARFRLAQIARNGGDVATAEKYLDEELKIHPKNDAVLVEQGNIRMAQNKAPEAAAKFHTALDANKKNADASFGLGVARHIEGKLDDALKAFADTLKLEPEKLDVHWQRGLIYEKQGDNAKALAEFRTYRDKAREPQFIARAKAKILELAPSGSAKK